MLLIKIPADAISDMCDDWALEGLSADIYDYFWADYHDRDTDTVTVHPNVVGNLAYLLNLLNERKDPGLYTISHNLEYLDADAVFSILKEDLLGTLSLPQNEIRVRVECIFEDLEEMNEAARIDFLSEMQHQDEVKRYYEWGRFH